MNVVEPIKDSELIKDVEEYLYEKSERDALLFFIWDLFRIYNAIFR